jgi:hypothetical protein
MLRWLLSLFRPSNPIAEFTIRQTELLANWFRIAAASGRPKWLTWVGYESLGDPIVTDRVALVPVLVRFEPISDAPLEDVPQAREPRSVVAVFRFEGEWTTDGRVVFNLTPQQVAEQMKLRSVRSP